jgi:hypothetical protein
MSEFIPTLPPSPSVFTVRGTAGGSARVATFYPGFVGAVSVNGEALYQQKPDGPFPFVLPAGTTTPFTTSSFQLQSDNGSSFTLVIEDPNLLVVSVQVTLRKPGGGNGDVVVIDDTATLCPPLCDPG